MSITSRQSNPKSMNYTTFSCVCFFYEELKQGIFSGSWCKNQHRSHQTNKHFESNGLSEMLFLQVFSEIQGDTTTEYSMIQYDIAPQSKNIQKGENNEHWFVMTESRLFMLYATRRLNLKLNWLDSSYLIFPSVVHIKLTNLIFAWHQWRQVIVGILCQMSYWWTKKWSHSINIWDTVTNVVPMYSVHRTPLYEPSLILLAPFST